MHYCFPTTFEYAFFEFEHVWIYIFCLTRLTDSSLKAAFFMSFLHCARFSLGISLIVCLETETDSLRMAPKWLKGKKKQF